MEIKRLRADDPVKRACEGDVSKLVARLRDHEVMLDRHEREFLADVLEGKPRRPAHRPPGSAVEQMATAMSITHLHDKLVADGWQRDAARDRCAEVRGVSRSTVNRAFRLLGR